MLYLSVHKYMGRWLRVRFHSYVEKYRSKRAYTKKFCVATYQRTLCYALRKTHSLLKYFISTIGIAQRATES